MNPVSRALSFVLKGNPSLLVLDYADKGTFSDLWLKGLESYTPEIAGHQVPWNDEHEVVLIVGGPPPAEAFKEMPECLNGINFRDHLTAASWAAAWRLRFPGAKARVVVLASSSYGTVGSIAEALATLFSAHDATGLPLVPGISFLGSPSLEILCESLNADDGEVMEPTPTVLAMLRTTLWYGLTSDRGDHHAVSNVLGALLLSSQVGRGEAHGGRAWAEDYLLALAKACGVFANSDQAEVKNRQGSKCWINPQIQSVVSAAVLIDDMADLWGVFLRNALGFASGADFTGQDRTFRESFVSSPDGKFFDELQGLPARLKAFLGSGDPFIAASDLISGQHKVKKDFVLFLDLRLFPKRGLGRSDQQAMFFSELAEFGLALLNPDRNLPWLDELGQELLRNELGQYDVTVSHQPSNGAGLDLPPEETLLPRLLSLLDPTLPIVIFSSTHHSELTDPFRDYGNIITTFRKPVVTAMTRDWIATLEELHADFVSALEKSAKVMSARSILQSFY